MSVGYIIDGIEYEGTKYEGTEYEGTECKGIPSYLNVHKILRKVKFYYNLKNNYIITHSYRIFYTLTDKDREILDVYIKKIKLKIILITFII